MSFAKKDGGTGRTSAPHQSRECGDDHQNWHADSQTSECQRTLPRDMSDIDAIDDVIQHVDHLRGHRRYGEMEQQLLKRFCGKK